MRAAETTSHHRYAVLDGVRGLAILLVLLSHLSEHSQSNVFQGLGQFGVWLFFVLSSFLLSLYFYEQPGRLLRPLEWTNYFVRRFLRIYPLFTLAMIAGVLAGWWHWRAIPDVLLLRDPAWWAIFVEFRFYFLLPFIAAAFALGGRLHKAVPFALIAAAFVAHYWLFPTASAVPGYEPSGPTLGRIGYEYIIVFVTGSFAAWLLVAMRDVLQRWQHSVWLDCVLCCGFILPWLMSAFFLQHVARLHVTSTWYHLSWAPWGVYFAVLIVGVMINDGGTRRVLAHPVMRFFGLVSYSTYMWMDFIIKPLDLVTRPIFPNLIFLAVVPIFAVAWLSFIVIERPFSRVTLLRRRAAPAELEVARSTALNRNPSQPASARETEGAS